MPKLTDPLRIGCMEIKNRLIAGPMVTNWGDYWGGVTEHLIESYETRAKGGWGMVTVEATTVDSRTNTFKHMLELSHPKHACDYNKLVEVIHRWGAKAVIQLQHAGRCSNPRLCDEKIWGDCTPLAPSKDTPPYPDRPSLREITEEEIEYAITRYMTVAGIAQEAGFDGVLLHYTHGFLPHQFMSPWTNKRTDKWGLKDGEVLFCTEVIQRVRQAVGQDFVIGARVPAEDALDSVTAMVNPAAGDPEEYLTLETMAKHVAPKLVNAGLDYLEVTVGQLEAAHALIPPLYAPRGTFFRYAEEIKKNVDVPVISGGKICDPLLAEKAVENGRVDAVFLARPSLADPESARKFLEGRRKEIRQCICCDFCTIQLFNQYEVKCAINPDIGPIKFRPLKKITNGKKVLVVGAGVGGMEAARIADWCGHQVILCEKRKEPGGIVQGASSLPRLYTRDLANILKWQKHQLSESSVDMKLGTEVTPEMVREIAPDAIILATGATSDGSHIPGHDREIVLTLEDYLTGDKETGHDVVVIGGAIGAEPALSIAKEGKSVTVLEEGPQFGPLKGVAFQSGLASAPWMYLYRTFWVIDEMSKTTGATIHTGVTVKEVTSEGVNFVDETGQDRSVRADTVILATGRRPNRTLKERLRDLDVPMYEIGDCVTPGTIRDAIYGAHHVIRDQLNEGLD